MTETRYILAGRLIDGSGAGVRRRVLLEVKDGRIAAISPAADLPSNAAVADLSHCTIVPALVDCSVSLLRSPSIDHRFSPKENDPDMLERHIHYCYAHGVLGVAVHDDNALLRSYLAKAEQSSLFDIRRSGDATEADFLRIVYSGNIEKEDRFSARSSLDALLQNRGKEKAVAVANGPQRAAEVLEAGCDAIEQGYGMGEEAVVRSAAASPPATWHRASRFPAQRLSGRKRLLNSLPSCALLGNWVCRLLRARVLAVPASCMVNL
jgi:hypothetical protein